MICPVCPAEQATTLVNDTIVHVSGAVGGVAVAGVVGAAWQVSVVVVHTV